MPSSVQAALKSNDLRADIDLRNESLNLKIREAQLQKIPFMLVVGNKEIEQGGVAVRLRSGENIGFMPLAGSGSENQGHLRNRTAGHVALTR